MPSLRQSVATRTRLLASPNPQVATSRTALLAANPVGYAGCCAAVRDMDQRPLWQPATLAEVSEAMIDGYFTPLGTGELSFY